ncbi:MAG: winged helix-turn-helix transcriptional regulator [Myxococcota bacterium]|nr:winged helix-turn-helix transcriptional regulator [Myxococcota bacterium]
MLSVLDAIAVNSNATQRELSKATGLNLAKVNYLLKRLVEKGSLKLRNVSRNPNKLGYLYILTPSGIAQKSGLTLRFAARTWREYSRAIERLRYSLQQLADTGVKQVLLLGFNDIANMVLDVIERIENLEVVGIFDPERQGEKHKGVRVIDDINDVEYDRAIPCEQISISDIKEKYKINEAQLWLI